MKSLKKFFSLALSLGLLASPIENSFLPIFSQEEPEEFSNETTNTKPTPLQLGVPVTGHLKSSTDENLYSIYLEPGTYTLMLTPSTSNLSSFYWNAEIRAEGDNSNYIYATLPHECDMKFWIGKDPAKEAVLFNIRVIATNFNTQKWLSENYTLTLLHFPDGANPDVPVNVKKMYRLYNPNSGEHFYTSDENEKISLVNSKWKYEGVGWMAPTTSKTPVYRLYNENSGDHHYTTDKNEKDTLLRLGWKDEKIGWYSDDQKAIPLYRQYNPNAEVGTHNYTVDKNENDGLVKAGWNAEGIAWYGVDTAGWTN